MIFLIESGIILNRDIWEIGAAGAQLPYKQTVTGSNPVSPTINYMPRICVAFLFWAFSSAGEHFLHTEGVIGSIPVTPTICFKVRLRRTFFRYKRNHAAWHSDSTAASPSPLDVRSTPGACFHGICTRQNPARCFDQLWEPIKGYRTKSVSVFGC